MGILPAPVLKFPELSGGCIDIAPSVGNCLFRGNVEKLDSIRVSILASFLQRCAARLEESKSTKEEKRAK